MAAVHEDAMNLTKSETSNLLKFYANVGTLIRTQEFIAFAVTHDVI